MIKKAYIILAHKNPLQLHRLVGSLNDGFSHFFVHIDSSTDIGPFRILLSPQAHISILPRIKTEWGGFGLVKAILSGLEAVVHSKEEFGRVILLSGQDYPIKSNEEINDFFESHKEKNFLEHFPLPCPAKWKPDGGLYRVNKYFLGLKTHQRYAAKSANFLGRLLPFMQRRTYSGMKAFAGSMWWIINRHAAQYIVNFVAANPGYVQFHRFTFAPDELFFHMILLNSKENQIRTSIINDDLHFIRWKDINASHPETIKQEDLDDLVRSDALFARKFDTTTDADILALVDTHCRTGNPVHIKAAVE